MTAAPASAERVDSGALKAEVTADPWSLTFTDSAGKAVLTESRAEPLGVRTAGGWARATRASSIAPEGNGLRARVATTEAGRVLDVLIAPAGEGGIRIESKPLSTDGVLVSGMGFEARSGERYTGFGERSDHVDGRGREVESYVSDGPLREEDRNYPKAVVPPWGTRDRDDSTYYPVPWMLSSAGYGVLVAREETSRFRLGVDRADSWSAEVDGATLALEVFAGPAPADALRRFTARTGRQPEPPAPWAFGPWFQTGQPNITPLAEEAALVKAQRDADVPISAAETQMHFLPCGAHKGNEDYERKRTAAFHAAGLAHLSYFNPSLCASYQPVYNQAASAGLLQKSGGQPFTYPAFVGGSGPAGFTSEPLSQFDFTHPGTEPFYEKLVREAFDQGKDGWMEDFGENTPPFVTAADGTTGDAGHNRYPLDYHCTVKRITRRLDRPVVRFQRSGWTGAARCADNVWGGDPTTVWGYDGLASVVTQGLSMGLSGVSRWGSDIGGYNTYGPTQNLTRELLERWIQMGAVSGVMRTKRSGLAVPSYTRPQVFDKETLPMWRRYTKLHTQLYPYIAAADAHYRRSGMPLMRHGMLIDPEDPKAVAADDQLGFGPDLLAAPVLTPGARTRKLYAPPGKWVDWWRSVTYEEKDGAFLPHAPALLEGGREHTLPAPRDELPLLARAGAVIPMLPAEVDTLAPYGGGGLVTLADREDQLVLNAFPRGRWTGAFGEDGQLASVEGRSRKRRRWVLIVRSPERRKFTVRAALGTLARPFKPRAVLVGKKRLKRGAWSYDARERVLTVTFTAARGSLRVESRRPRKPGRNSRPRR
ncbi:MAG: glycoside hydrolase family 31 protein [Thermoleophilaceae bacterium]|nr:glycoside hydrolase family 31 protein [Thermoleophilaceae bacterium]